MNLQNEANLQTFSREDWTLFRTLNTLTQRAGVGANKLAAVVAKELTDNAIDAIEGLENGRVEVGPLEENGFYVADNGPGLPVDQLGELFSIHRPLTSSKLLRRPTRGALGNGLRVVTGAVLASGGTLTVHTSGQVVSLEPQDDGSTITTVVGLTDQPGTRVEVHLGDSLRVAFDSLEMAKDALAFFEGDYYRGKTSPYWYDTDSFFELLQAAGGRSIRDLISEFDGCSGARAGQIADGFQGRLAASLTREEADAVLERARVYARPVKAQRLGKVGDVFNNMTYASATGSLHLKAARGSLGAEIPVLVEAWCREQEYSTVECFVNKTPITADFGCWTEKNKLTLYCGDFVAKLPVGRTKPGLVLNIQTPYMPITSDGKAPNLSLLRAAIVEAAQKAINKAKRYRAATGAKSPTQKAVIFANVEQAADHCSSYGTHRFSQRQLFYAIRPTFIDIFDKEPDYKTFSGIITEYENEYGDIPGMYRDPRGTLYHPHTGEQIPLGTLEVEQYARPAWAFNKILYVEKEGFFPILQAENWPERHDCALLTSKGQASRAAKDLIDLLGNTGEELTFFCIHDADAAGTMIYQSLQEATKARPSRSVQVINLGLEPWEAESMGLQYETTSYKDPQPVANYVPEPWRRALQSRRVELNAMTTAQFIAWLDRKMEAYSGKVNPPGNVSTGELTENVRTQVSTAVRERILKSADYDKQARQAFERMRPMIEATAETLPARISTDLAKEPAVTWRRVVERVATELVNNGD